MAAAVAIGVVVLTLILSRLDLANEVAAVRSQLAVANAEIAENQREIDELEDTGRGQAEDVAACGDLADMSKRLEDAVALLQRAVEGGDQAGLARGISLFTETRDQWVQATQGCAEATQGEEEGEGEGGG